jgi:hypothetical protein
MSDLFGVGGTRLLDELQLGRAYGLRVASLRSLITAYDQEIAMLGREIAAGLAGDVGYLAIQAIPGVGPVLAAVFVAEIGNVHRFAAAPQLCSWAGLTPVTASPTPPCAAARSPTREPGWSAGPRSRPPSGSPQPASRPPGSTASPTGGAPAVGRVAAARRLLRLVFYGLRDGQVRCLAPALREAMGTARAQPGACSCLS